MRGVLGDAAARGSLRASTGGGATVAEHVLRGGQQEDMRAGTTGIKRKGVSDAPALVAVDPAAARRKRARRQELAASVASAQEAKPTRQQQQPQQQRRKPHAKAGRGGRSDAPLALLLSRKEVGVLAKLRAQVGRDFDSGLYLRDDGRGSAQSKWLQLAPVRPKHTARGAPTDSARHAFATASLPAAEDGARLVAAVYAPPIQCLEDYHRCKSTWATLRKMRDALHAPLVRNASSFRALERAVRAAAAAEEAAAGAEEDANASGAGSAVARANAAVALRYAATLPLVEQLSEEQRCVRIAARALAERAEAWVALYRRAVEGSATLSEETDVASR